MKPNSPAVPLAALWLAFILAPSPARAASALPPNPSGERFLFVVDKSSDMEKLQDATEATIFDLIGSGLYGQMQPGDTFGLWTFTKEVSAGKFSMQVWDPRKARQQATVVAAFLSGVEYDGSSDLKDVAGKLKSIVHSVSNVTMFVISDGGAPMKGTPFDKTINAEYKRQRKQRASAKRPFVTTLIARDGWIIDQSVVIAGTRIALPPRIAPPPEPTPAIAATTPANPIVSAPAVPKPAPRMTIITKKPDETNAAPQTQAPAQAATVIAATTEPEAAAKPPVAPPAPVPAPEPVPKHFEIASQESILATTGRMASAGAEPVAAPAVPAPRPEAAPSTAQGISRASDPTAAAAIPVSSATIDQVLATLRPEPVPVAARESAAVAISTNAGATATMQGAGTPLVTTGHPVWLMTFGGLMLAAALFLACAVFRQRRPAIQASLITQSMNRQ